MGGLVVDTQHFAGKNAKNSLQILHLEKLSSQFPLSCYRVNPRKSYTCQLFLICSRDIFILRVPGVFNVDVFDVFKMSEEVQKTF